MTSKIYRISSYNVAPSSASYSGYTGSQKLCDVLDDYTKTYVRYKSGSDKVYYQRVFEVFEKIKDPIYSRIELLEEHHGTTCNDVKKRAGEIIRCTD